ncbi:MAG: hypothetical protein WBQ38_14770 [Ignavibacteria bacterium]|nr:hypothetical protein [Ignavibacteria bacterium]MBK8383823.1 hypothetical protein [Ignavibacteria bacterium]MBK9403693.1 hypothetical protein [Ignavibacteria bacterium]
MKFRILLFEAFIILLLIFKLSFAQENKKINIKFDKLDFDVLPVTNSDQYLMLIVTVNNSSNLNEITEYVGLQEKGRELKPYFISPDINVKLTGLIFYKFGSNKINCGEDGKKVIVDIKNKKSFTVCGSSEIQNSIDHYLKDEIIESEIIFSLLEAERKNNSEDINSIKKSYDKTLGFSNTEYLNKLFIYQYLMYYYEKFVEPSGINYINRLDNSYSLGNRNDDFLKIYFDESLAYADTLFENKKYDTLIIFAKSKIDIFKNIKVKDSFKRLKFYELYSEYYLMKTDKEIIDESVKFIKEFGYYINEFKETNKDLKYISLLSLGNINYIKGNYSEAIDLYEKILKGEEVKEEIKKKAENNKDKADNKIKGN